MPHVSPVDSTPEIQPSRCVHTTLLITVLVLGILATTVGTMGQLGVQGHTAFAPLACMGKVTILSFLIVGPNACVVSLAGLVFACRCKSPRLSSPQQNNSAHPSEKTTLGSSSTQHPLCQSSTECSLSRSHEPTPKERPRITLQLVSQGLDDSMSSAASELDASFEVGAEEWFPDFKGTINVQAGRISGYSEEEKKEISVPFSKETLLGYLHDGYVLTDKTIFASMMEVDTPERAHIQDSFFVRKIGIFYVVFMWHVGDWEAITSSYSLFTNMEQCREYCAHLHVQDGYQHLDMENGLDLGDLRYYEDLSGQLPTEKAHEIDAFVSQCLDCKPHEDWEWSNAALCVIVRYYHAEEELEVFCYDSTDEFEAAMRVPE